MNLTDVGMAVLVCVVCVRMNVTQNVTQNVHARCPCINFIIIKSGFIP